MGQKYDRRIEIRERLRKWKIIGKKRGEANMKEMGEIMNYDFISQS